MKRMIIYDSAFGNTKEVAMAMGKAIEPKHNIVFGVSDVKVEQLVGLDVLIVGSPTQAFRPLKPIAEFLDRIPSGSLKGVKVAAFDTRISPGDVKMKLLKIMVKMFGYAADPIADKLKKKGGELVVPPEGFCVKDTKGPMKDGEMERAVAWARKVCAK